MIANNGNYCENIKYFYVQEDIFNEIDNKLQDCEKKHLGKYLYPIHAVNTGKIMNRNLKNGMIRLNSEILQEILTTRHYGKIKEFLIKNRLIDCDNSYSTNHESMAYSIPDEYLFSPLRKIPINDRTICKKLTTKDNNFEPIEKVAFQNLKQVEIDFSGAKNFVLNRLKDEAQKLPIYTFYQSINSNNSLNTNNYNKVVPPYVVTFLDNELYFNNLEVAKNEKNELKSIFERFNCANISIDYIQDRNFFIYRDSVGRRLHSNITNFPSDLRQFLKVKDYNLVNIDIANSQPFILNTLLVENDIKTKDSRLYKTLTSEGQFWYYLMDKCDVSDKKKFKATMFEEVFYGRPGRKRHGKSARLFRDEFPTVWQFIKDFKRNDLKENYSRLAIEMQRRESQVMIDLVARDLTRKKIFWLSIHDSFLCDLNDVEYVKKSISRFFKKQYQITPTLRIEKL